MPAIPFHQLHERADDGVEIDYFRPGDHADEAETLGAHRDDHYIFFFVESGSARLMIDFETITFTPGSLYFVLPGQVHHRISNEMAYGWFLAIDTGILLPEQRRIFEERLALQMPLALSAESQQRYNDFLQTIYRYYQQAGQPFYRQVLFSMVQALTGMIAADYQATEDKGLPASRKTQLTQQFKTLLTTHIKTEKSPAAYAEKLHVSTAYLNEALKQTTGLPVSYWIIQEVLLEAKRLLYYTHLNVKQVAHELGYGDHAYFSRLFKQQTGQTPLAFHQYHE